MGIIQSSFNQVASEAVKVSGVIKPLLEQTKLTPELLNKYADKLLSEQRNLNTSIQGIAKANELITHLDEANDKPFVNNNTDTPLDKKNVLTAKENKSGQFETIEGKIGAMARRIEEEERQRANRAPFKPSDLYTKPGEMKEFIKQHQAINNLNQLSLAKERQKIMKSIMRDSYKGGIK